MKKKSLIYSAAFFATFFFLGVAITSCEDDNLDPDNGTETESDGGQFIIAAASTEASYLLQADSIDSGEISIVNNGVECESSTHWLFPQEKYAYGLQYRQGSSGVCTSFMLDENGNLEARTAEFEMPRFTAFGTYNEYLVLGAAAATDQYAENDTEQAYPKYGVNFTTVDAEQQVKYEYTFVTENLLGDGEYFTVSGFVSTNGKIYSSLCPLGVSSYGVSQGVVVDENADLISEGSISGTLNPNVALLAIYDGVDAFASAPSVVEDDRISYATGRYRSQYYPTIFLADDGYIYVFSNSYAKSAEDARQKTTLDAGVIRLDPSTDEFDEDYYYSIEDITGGYTFFQVWYVSGSKFLMKMYDDAGDIGTVSSALTLAVFDVSTGSYTKVTGFPDAAAFGEDGSIGRFIYAEDGKAYVPVVTADGEQPAIYVIDAETAVATKGITVEADGGISAIGKLYKE